MRNLGFDLNLLLAFEALYQERSVTAASRRLGLGQPAMSGALARLRRLLGDPLLERVGRGMSPTPKAHALAPRLIAALEDLRQTVQESVPFQPDATTRIFSVASTDYTSMVLAPGLVARLRQDAPGVELRILGYDKDTLAQLLDRNEIDLALGVFPHPPERAVMTPLFAETFVGVARRDHPALREGTMALEDFAALPHALITLRRDTRGVVDDALALKGLSRRVAVTLPHLMTLPEVLRDSDLIAAAPLRLARLMGDAVSTFQIPVALEPWRVSCLWNPNQRTDPAGAWLRGLLQEVARNA